MKKIALAVLVLGLTGCAMGSGRTIVIGDPRTPAGPALDLRVGIFNNSSRWVKIQGVAGFSNMIIGPNKEVFLQCRRLGRYEATAFAYRGARATTKRVKLSGYIGDRRIRINLTGSTRKYNGQYFGAVIIFTDNQFRYRPEGFTGSYQWGPVSLKLF